jgi:trimeric autotransporter adhesin
MSKKKAAKLGLTAAVAASAFVAGNPADAAATKADQLVTNAVNAAKQLKPFYGSTSLEVSAEFTAKFNAAKAAVAKAKAAKLNDYQSYQVQKAEEEVLRAARYIDAVKVVNNELQPALDELQGYIDDQEIGDEMKTAYDNLSEKIRKAERVIGKVYGAPIREAFLSEFVLPAKIAKETVIYEVSRFNLLNVIDAHIKADELKEAEEKIAMLERLEKRSVEIKEAGNKLHPGKYPELPEIEKALVAKKEAVVKAYEEKLSPAVVSVSAINASQIVVKFNKAVDKTTAETTANYVLTKGDGSTIAVTSAKVKEDGKSVLLTVTPITTKTTFTLTVKNVKLNGSLTEVFPLYSQVLTVEDKENPEITDVVAKTNSDVATSVTVYFSEPVTAGAFKINGATKSYRLASDGLSATISGLSLDANKTHTLEIVNLTDTANNVNTLTSKTFNVTKDVTAPTFTVSTESDNKIVLTFDKAVDVNTINTTNIVLKDEKLDTVAGYSVSVPTGFDNKRVEITLPAGTYASKDTRSFTILASDVKDYLGNKLAATTKTVTITKDVTAPKLTGVEYVKDSTGKVIHVLFKYDEKVLETTNLGLVAKDIVTGASVDLFGTLTSSDVDVLSDGKTVKVDVKGAAVVKSGKLEISVPANFVKDTALTSNFSKTEKLVVDFGAGTASELKVQSVTNLGRNQFKVTFNDVVTYASATNPANYTINGVALPANTTIVFDTTNKNNVTITLPSGFITEDDTGAVLRVQNVETATGTKVSPNTNVVTVDDNAGPVIVKEKSAINSNGTLSIGFSETVIAASASALNDLVFTVNGSTVTVGNGNVTVVDGTGSDAGKYVVTFNTDVSGPDADGKYYEYFDIDGDNTLDATDIIVQTSTSALTPGVFNLSNVSSLKVGTVAAPSVITDTNTYGSPAVATPNTIVEKQSVVIK